MEGLKKIIIPNGVEAVVADYKEQVIADYKGNPLIEALPDIISKFDAMDQLAVYPYYDENERYLESHYRCHLIQRLFQYFQPLGNHLDLYNRISIILRQGYIARNPINIQFTGIFNNGYEAILKNNIEMNDCDTFRTSASGFTVIGVSGMGKTTTINRILSNIPQVIAHSRYKDNNLSMYQLAWLKLECPYDGSIKALCLDFFGKVDGLLGTNYFKKYCTNRLSTNSMIPIMAQVARNTGLGMLISEELIYNHTMFPYFTAFITEDRARTIYQYMLSDNGSKIHAELGLSNSCIKLNTYLRFCPECVEEDLNLYGETYWHRIHQVAGLNFCIKHNKPLYNSSAAIRLKNRQEYVNAMIEICIDRNNKSFKPIEIIGIDTNVEEAFNTFEDIKNKSLIIGRNIEYLLNNKGEFKELNYFREFYLNRLIQNKLASGRNLIYQDELLPKFKSFWGETLLEDLNCNLDIDKHFNWVSTITRKHRKGFHPIQHILFAEFLGINIADMFNSKEVFIVKKKKYQSKSKDEVMEKRNRWLELMKMYPHESKTFIRDKDRAVYTWLHRHDNEWLSNNSPKKKVGIGKEQVVDWYKRDEEILELVKVAVDALKNTEDKPERITKTLVAKRINKITLLQRNLDRLPRTEEFLNNNIESLEEFQLRRVKWAIKELAKEGEVKEWDVIIKAGLSKKFYIRLKEILKIYML